MKTLFLSITALLFSTFIFSQNCARVVTAYITNPSNDNFNYIMTVNWNSDGQKHIFVNIYCGNITGANLVSGNCIDISCAANCSGTTTYNFQCSGQVPTATFTPYTGNCNGGTQCGPTQQFVPGGGVPLLVRLSSFTASRSDSKISLTWQTLSENNAKEFIIEKKSANNFIATGAVPATNNPAGSSYFYIDNDAGSSVVQYRLKMMDIDGSYVYSETRNVKEIIAANNANIFPNPNNGSPTITLSGITIPAVIQLIDNQGRLCKTINLSYGNTIEIDDLKTGIYLVRIKIRNTGEILSQKITVIN